MMRVARVRASLALTVAAITVAITVAAPARATPILPGFARIGTGPDGGSLYRGTIPWPGAPQPLRPGYVYLPPSLAPGERYPVVYLLHGMPGDPSEYTTSLGLATVADGLISSGAVKPFVAVVPAAGPDVHYDGEWAGPWESYLVDAVVPWVDAHLPTIPARSGRVLAGLSAGGYGAMDIGLRTPRLFGTIESWSGYFHPLHDGPLKHATPAQLAAHDPALLLAERAPLLRDLGTRFFVGSGPSHSHWFKEQETVAFAGELRRLALPHTLVLEPSDRGQYAEQLDAGLSWALRAA
jgi:S-formylglutathione hydrolase FrmB